MPIPVVIDLSHHNVIPASLVPAREAGIVGLIHKATEGESYIDDALAARHFLAREAGMLFGGYHFLRPGDMEAQAEHFHETMRPYLAPDVLLVADHEDPDVSLDDLMIFLTTLEEFTDHSPVVYSGHVLKEQIAADPAICPNDYRLWLCHYTSGKPVLPPGFSSYWLWQYTDKGEVPGITPPTDLNAIDVPLDNFIASWTTGTLLFPPAPPTYPPAPQPQQTYTATITITSSAPIEVSVAHAVTAR